MGLHVNPLKKRIVYVPNESTGGRIKQEEEMTWEDAAKISLVLMLAQVFIGFLILYDWSRVAADPLCFLWDLFKFAGASFFMTFLALTGLSRYASR